MDFAILGPLEIINGDRRIRLGPPKQRTVLAILICHANTVVSADRLVDEVWGAEPPKTAHENLHVYVYHLRRELGAKSRIVRHEAGYMLAVGPGELDAERFEDLAARGRLARSAGDYHRAARLFTEALVLWRGAAFAGLENAPALNAEAARLAERRLTLLEERIQVDLMLGRDGELVAELSQLAAEHPVRERFRAQLMVALFRSGRQTEALAVYREAQRSLADELGLDPSPDLQQLHQAMLSGSALPDAYRQVTEQQQLAGHRAPAQLPPDIADFIDRTEQIDEISALLTPGDADKRAPRALVVLAIAGMGGIGKTALAVHVAHRLTEAFPDGQLYVNLRGAEATPLEAATVLARFLRALGVTPDVIPEDLDERIELYRSRLAGRQVLVVLDNAANEEQIRPLLPGSSTCAVLITSRTRLTALEGARLLDLDVLGPDQAIELLGHIAGPERISAEPDAAAEIVRLCGHLPLALRTAAVRLAARPQGTLARFSGALADERRRLDELATGDLAVRASLTLSYDWLSRPARRMLRLLGLLDAPDFAGWMAAALVDTPTDQAESHLEALVDAQLLTISGIDGSGHFRYRLHDLVRVFARERAMTEETADGRTRALARAFGGLLALMEKAHRLEYGGDHTTLHGPADRWAPGEEDVAAILADQPYEWFELERLSILAAIRQSATMGADELCWDLAMTATTLFEAGSYLDDWSTTHEQALAATRAAGNARGEAAVLHSLGALKVLRKSYQEARSCLEKAIASFAELGERHGHALAQRNLAFLDRMTDELDTARHRYEQSSFDLHEVGNRSAEAHALRGLAQVHIERGEVGEALSSLSSALSIWRDIGSRRGEAQVLRQLGELFLEDGRLDEAENAFEQMLDVVVAGGDRVGELYARHGLAEVLARRGRSDLAFPLFTEVLEAAREIDERFVEGRTLLSLGRLNTDDGRFDQATNEITQASVIFRDLAMPRWQVRALEALGTALSGAGDRSAARESWAEAHRLLAAAPDAERITDR